MTEVLKFSTKQTLSVAAGVTGILPVIVCNLLEKKGKIPENNKFKHVKKEVLKGAKKALLIAFVAGSIHGTKIYKEKQQEKELQKELQKKLVDKKEKFFKEHNTTNEAFFENYNTIKEHEKELICLLSCSENFKSEAYLCQAGEWTIGYGSRFLSDGTKVEKGMTITKSAAVDAVQRHLNKYVYPQLNHIVETLSLNQLAAVCSFIYNTNEKEFKNSCVCKAINEDASDNKKIREAFSMYRNVKGKRSYGLINANGLRGYIYSSNKNIMHILVLKDSFMGSPDICCYSMKDHKNPKENVDGSFVLRELGEVKDDFDKFKTPNIKDTPLDKLPETMRDELVEKYSIEVEDGRLKGSVR